MSIKTKRDRMGTALQASRFSDQQINEIAQEKAGIGTWVSRTAAAYRIAVRRHPNDNFVRAVSRLSDGVADLDQTEELLVALARAGVISAFQRGLLQVQYLR